MTKKAVTLEIPELIQFLVEELHDLPDDRKPGNNTKYQVEDAVKAAFSVFFTWIATDPTNSGDRDYLIIGDLNAYAQEDPIRALESAGYTNLVGQFGGINAYSYVFDGQAGYLDHALANASLASQVTGVTEWHINADEPSVFDYDDNIVDPGENPSNPPLNPSALYQVNPYRTSDHDPVLIGLNLTSNSHFKVS
jgi:predicted extracellular nuclease